MLDVADVQVAELKLVLEKYEGEHVEGDGKKPIEVEVRTYPLNAVQLKELQSGTYDCRA